MYFDNNPDLRPQADLFGRPETPPPPLKDLSFIPPETLRQSLTAYDRNNFVKWLHSLFDADLVTNLVECFNVGTSKHWNGATVFWQVDTDLKVRQAKVMLYNPTTGKRLKEDSEPDKGKGKVYFAGKSILRQKGIEAPELRQCFFGEHQLSRETGQILAIAESEKTAILMTAFARLGIAPKYTWLATGGKNGAKWTTPEVFEVLAGCGAT
ncbi:MAG: hypothetical protein H6577_27830 [Lewinellaceae bacterium]|nr:hypothetical protein [Lewinellaceae bacterium]